MLGFGDLDMDLEMKKVFSLFTIAFLVILFFSGCVAQESRFVGTWDGEGEGAYSGTPHADFLNVSIVFSEDSTFIFSLEVWLTIGGVLQKVADVELTGTWEVDEGDLILTSEGTPTVYSFTLINNQLNLVGTWGFTLTKRS